MPKTLNGTEVELDGPFGSFTLHKNPSRSAVFLAGYVTYANEAKEETLGLDPRLIAAHGAVSEPVARAMAEGARQRAGATFGVATTGIAGPGGGRDEKPVGTVFIALAGPEGTTAGQHLNRFDRETFKYLTAQAILQGIKLGDELDRIGYKGRHKAGAVKFSSMFELHIEQGPILEDETIDVGVVTHGQGQRWYELVLTGQESHAGPTPMPVRPRSTRCIRAPGEPADGISAFRAARAAAAHPSRGS